MSYDVLLVNTCTIKRFSEEEPDNYGHPVKAWTNHLIDEPCRWSTPQNWEVKVGAEVVLADLQLFLGDVDITEQDRVVLDGSTYEILSTTMRQNGVSNHHTECLLRRVK